MVRTIDFRDWLARAEAQRARVEAIEASFAAPYRRERPRDHDEAEFLGERGTPDHLIGPSSDDDVARRAFAAPRQAGLFRGIDLSLLDPADHDDRQLLVQAEHRELADALDRGEDVVTIADEEVNPRLHLTLHDIVVQQLWENDPPEVWKAARRLLRAGYERHEILHMLGSALVPQLWRTLRDGEPADHDEYIRALAGLPAGWEPERAVPGKKAGRLVGKRKRGKR